MVFCIFCNLHSKKKKQQKSIKKTKTIFFFININTSVVVGPLVVDALRCVDNLAHGDAGEVPADAARAPPKPAVAIRQAHAQLRRQVHAVPQYCILKHITLIGNY